MNPTARSAKIGAARETAESLSWPVVTKRLLNLYEEMTAITRNSQLQPLLSPRTWSTETKLQSNCLILVIAV
jgi:hypothetical protein